MSKLLWQPSEQRMKNTNMYRFMNFVNQKFSLNFTEYKSMHEWSVQNLADFWACMWEFAEIKASKPYDQVADDFNKMPGTEWFTGARLNFAENLLRYRDDQTALIFKGEAHESVKMTYAQLYDEVACVAQSMKHAGLESGDRVVGFMPNMPHSIVGMLAAVSIGAIWSSCSPDFGIKGVLDRFGQIKPKILFTADGYFFKGRKIDSLERISSILKQLPSIQKVIVVPYTQDRPDISNVPNSEHYEDFKSPTVQDIEFEQLPFGHPLYIMYSSGTTGLPKCMVQSAGGILINQLKEMILHTDVKRDDTIFYFTTCGWMMWNWLVSALGVGATLVLYDGNPFHPDPGTLWKMAQDEKITVFGTSAGYIAALRDSGLKPAEKYDLTSLRAVLSTGSPLSVESFEYIYNHVKMDLQLASISGGTDLNGCFALGNPIGPVYAGELQCRGLGMNVKAFSSDHGNPVTNQEGELVCTSPFPSMPIYFWEDPKGEKYHSAYFDVYPNVWRHGDYVVLTERGGLVMSGRSDATLNPGGVRIGTAEIYRHIDRLDEIADSVVVGQTWKNDVRVILFVKLAQGIELTEQLKNKIKQTLRANASPRHVPAKIIAIPDVPYTLNMKKVELAVKKVIENRPVLNKDALSNPEALDYYANIKELQED